jgi:hypothetical protein
MFFQGEQYAVQKALAGFTSDIRAVFLHYCQLDPRFAENWPPTMALAQWNLYCRDTGTSGEKGCIQSENIFTTLPFGNIIQHIVLVLICALHTLYSPHQILGPAPGPRAWSLRQTARPYSFAMPSIHRLPGAVKTLRGEHRFVCQNPVHVMQLYRVLFI